MKKLARIKWLISLVILFPLLSIADENSLPLGSWQGISRDEASISSKGFEGSVRLRKKLSYLDNTNTFAEVLVFDYGTLLYRHDNSVESIPSVQNRAARKQKLLKYLVHEEIRPLQLQSLTNVKHIEYHDKQSGGKVMLTSGLAKGKIKTCFFFYKAKIKSAKTSIAESAEGVFCQPTNSISSVNKFTNTNQQLAKSFVFDKGRHAQEFAVAILGEKLDKYYLNIDRKGPTVNFTYVEHIPSSNSFLLSGKAIDQTGIGFIKINGVRLTNQQLKATIDRQGNFNLNVQIKGGRSGALKMEFADRSRNVTVRSYGINVARALRRGKRPVTRPIVLQGGTGRGKVYALLVAVGSYQDKSLSSLYSPVPDVKSVAGALSQIGVARNNMLTLFNPSKAQFLKTVDGIKRRFKVGDQLIVYYSGHGVLSSKSKEGYWAFRDTKAEPMRPQTWLSNNEFRKRLLEFNKGGVIIVADSCFSGSFIRHYFDNANQLSFNTNEEARAVLTSGGIAPVADTSNGSSINSEFAVSFVKALKRMRVEAKRRNETSVPGFFLFGLTAKQQRLKHQQLPNYGSFVNVVSRNRKFPDFSLNIR